MFVFRPILVLLIICSALAASCNRSNTNQESAQDPSRLIPKPCWFETDDSWPTTQCYMMEVPENHAKPDGRKIQFPVVRFLADTPDPAKLPLLHLGAGGPGASMGLEPKNASEWLWVNYAEMSVDDGRDLLVIDPRGTGMATPKLTCDEFIHDADIAFKSPMTPDEEARVFTFSMERCYSRLSAIADLGYYNSTAVAQDVEELRKQLGVEKLNLYGVSYASRYALTLARDFPDSVRALILNSAVFPEIIYAQQLPQDVTNAYKRGLDYCSKDSDCATRYPNLNQRLERLVETLDVTPITVETANITESGDYPFVLNGQRLLRVLFQALYNERFYSELPAIIQELETGHAQLLKPSIVSFMGLVLDPNFGDAAGVSHFCYEEAPFVDFPKARALAASSGVLGGSVRTDIDLMQVQCRIWAIPSAAMEESKPVKTPLPVLVMHGGLDPVLSAIDAEKARRKLPNHQWILFPELAHDVVSASDCAEQAAAKFLNNPEQTLQPQTDECRHAELAKQRELQQELEQARLSDSESEPNNQENLEQAPINQNEQKIELEKKSAASIEAGLKNSADPSEPAQSAPTTTPRTENPRHREAPATGRLSENP